MSSLSLRKRKSDERGTTDLEWLSSQHTFSFGNYVDPEFVGWALRY